MQRSALKRYLLPLLILMASCSRGDDHHHGHHDRPSIFSCESGFSLPPNKPVNLLNQHEIIYLCDEIDRQQTPDQLCTAMASQRTTDPAQCASIRDHCLREGPVKESCYGEAFLEALASCEEDITVSFFKMCFEEQIAAANELSCVEPRGLRLRPLRCFRRLSEHCEQMFQ